MSVLNLLYYPDPGLRIKAEPVKKMNSKINKIINDMFETMYFQEGIGLAATQVGINLKIIVINIDQIEEIVLINPKLIEKYGNSYIEEGCLSIPDQRAKINRSNFIKIQAINRIGNKIEITASSLLSICIQHEMDHLEGKLFIDYLSLLKQNRIEKKIKKLYKFKNHNKYEI
ncbi:Peptide deformylase [Buchnera aphidicola (Eriosoma lanigerum)]|uniref:peptide deformylase n=1 Tax=Buchnera aphidicola TaxID=9 RepID=UPI003464D55E